MGQTNLDALRWRAGALTLLLPAFVVLRFAFAYFEASGQFVETADDSSMVAVAVALLFVLSFFACVVVTAMWLHQANSNLHAAGIEMAFSPSWAWGWYFIPFANLFKPFQAMREIWNESHRTRDTFAGYEDALMRTWWGCWIVGNILSNVTSRLGSIAPGSSFEIVNLLEAVMLSVAALLLLRIVRQVTAAQADLGSAGVFA
jgi:hypothetical protein